MKDVIAKFYDPTGKYLGYLDTLITSNFTKSINGGAGSCTVDLPYKFDSFDSFIDLNNRVDVWIYDAQAPSGVKIYSGFIFDLATEAADNEKITISLAGYIATLERSIYETLESTPRYVFTVSPQEIANTFKSIIDSFITYNSGTTINYNSGSIQNTGKSRGITFNNSSYLDCVKSLAKILNPNWYWYLDIDNTFYLQPFATTPKHYFYMEKDIIKINDTKSISTLNNEILFWNGLPSTDANYIAKRYSNAASIAKYGRATQLVNDNRYVHIASADDYANRTLGLLSEATRQITLDIVDDNYGLGYDIESINPGDTFKILNSNINYNMMIVSSVNYNYSSVTITADDYKNYIERSTLELKKNLQASQYTQNAPITYA